MYLAQLLVNALIGGTQVALVTVALYMVYSVSRITHLALGATGAAAAYAAYYIAVGQGSEYWAIAAGLLAAVLLGWLAYLLLERFAARQEPLSGLLVSLGLAICIEAIIAILFGTAGRNFSGRVLPVLYFRGLQITFAGAVTVVGGLIMAVAATVATIFTPWGRRMRGMSENISSIMALGVDQRRSRLLVYIGAAVLAGFAATTQGLHTALVPLMGFNLVVMAFIALLIGGTQDIRGGILAAYVLSLIPEVLIGFSAGEYSISPSWRMAIMFLLAFVALSLRPEGLLAIHRRKE